MKRIVELAVAFLGRRTTESSYRLQMVAEIATMPISELLDLAEWVAYHKTKGGDG